MNFVSTRGKSKPVNFSTALKAGLAEDGGLHVPQTFPQFSLSDFKSKKILDISYNILEKFLAGDLITEKLHQILNDALSFPIPLTSISRNLNILELFHGPTAAFKDVGARFLAGCVDDSNDSMVLVATSGDTGGAVASAFNKKKRSKVFILFPEGKVSSFQQKQLTCWGKSVVALAVRGSFDDCQRIVKQAFEAKKLFKGSQLLSANSINIGRILPQTLYYAWASMKYLNDHGANPDFIVPTGNMGNGVAALWAKKMGFPIAKVILAFNANGAVEEYFQTGDWKPRPTVYTLANAMDVGKPSNMERLLHLYPDLKQLRQDVEAYSVKDSEIKNTIIALSKEGYVCCPHTACAIHVSKKLSRHHMIVASTAHPAKFKSVVEPLIGKEIPSPAHLKQIENSKESFEVINANLESLIEKVLKNAN